MHIRSNFHTANNIALDVYQSIASTFQPASIVQEVAHIHTLYQKTSKQTSKMECGEKKNDESQTKTNAIKKKFQYKLNIYAFEKSFIKISIYSFLHIKR